MACKAMCTFAIHVAIGFASVASAGAAHAEVALGASFGYTHLSSNDDGFRSSVNVVGIPGTDEFTQPGIRVGYIAPGRLWDLNADVGLVHWSSSLGSHGTQIELLPQFQMNARGSGGFSAFGNGGVGVVYTTVPTSFTSSISATRTVFGAGIGVRKSISEDHGLLRVELRFDHVPKYTKEESPSSSFTFLAADLYSVKLGFDLLVAR